MKKCINVLLFSLFMSTPLHALTIYKDDTNKVDLTGAVLMDYWKPVHFLDHGFNSSRTTLGISIENQLSDKWSADVNLQWDTIFNPPPNEFGNKNNDKLRNRLGYMTLNNESFGSLRIGKQYSAYYDVAGYMDNLIVFDPDATPLFSDGKDGGFLATARGDNLLVYRKEFNALNLSLQFGFNGVDNRYSKLSRDSNMAVKLSRDSNMAVAVSYDFDNGLSLGATHMQNKVEGDTIGGLADGDTQEVTTIAAKYSLNAFKVAVAFNDSKKAHETDLLGYGFDGTAPTGKANLFADAQGFDLYAEYYFEVGLRPYVYFSQVNFDDNAVNIDGERSSYTLGLSYHVAPKFIVSAEVRQTEEDKLGAGKQDDTLSGITVLYAF